jgi:hypothetical protein
MLIYKNLLETVQGKNQPEIENTSVSRLKDWIDRSSKESKSKEEKLRIKDIKKLIKVVEEVKNMLERHDLFYPDFELVLALESLEEEA